MTVETEIIVNNIPNIIWKGYGGRNEQINLLPARKYTLRKKKHPRKRTWWLTLDWRIPAYSLSFHQHPEACRRGAPVPVPTTMVAVLECLWFLLWKSVSNGYLKSDFCLRFCFLYFIYILCVNHQKILPLLIFFHMQQSTMLHRKSERANTYHQQPKAHII